MKKLLLFVLIFSACWSAPEEQSITLNVETEMSSCEKPLGLNTFYNETEKTIDVLWEASTSNVMHYMISLNGEAYQVVDFVNHIDSKYPGRKFSFTDLSEGTHTICVRSVCMGDQSEGKIPLPSQEICTQLQSVSYTHLTLPTKA